MQRVALFSFGSVPNFKSRTDAFRKGMEERGYVEGQNVVIVTRSANGQDDLLQDEANKLVASGIDVLVSSSTITTQALKKATSKIPIVMASVDDPVADGFARSLARPEGNCTGLTGSVIDQAPRFFELLSSAVGKVTRVGALLNPENATYRPYRASLEAAARKAGVQLIVVDAATPDQIERAFGGIDDGRVDGAIVMADGNFYTDRSHITELAYLARLPAIYTQRGYVEAGGLMSYGPNPEHCFYRAASFVDKILKGASPRDLPIEQPTKYELTINRVVVRSLGLTLPPDLLKRADRLIGKV
jgi:putative ABC transport system substrate-binding protein